jgi:Na+-transporting NADH:ubiquinone oxidoreductase subunit NqrF
MTNENTNFEHHKLSQGIRHNNTENQTNFLYKFIWFKEEKKTHFQNNFEFFKCIFKIP